MDTVTQSTTPDHLPTAQILLALLPLILLAVGITLNAMPIGDVYSERPLLISALGFMGTYPVVLFALLWGWLKGFPRWVYPYLAYAIFFALYIANASTPGFSLFGVEMWGRQTWGWRAFVPLLFAVGLALALSKPEQRNPFPKALREIWTDPTLLVYGLYGLLPLLIPILLDETGRTHRFIATAIGSLIMLVGAACYLAIDKEIQFLSKIGFLRLRTTLLLAGLYLSITAAWMGSSLYWGTHDVDMTTYEHFAKTGPVPWGEVLLPSIGGSLIFTLVLLALPGLVVFARWLNERQNPR